MMAYTGWCPRIFLEQIIDILAIGASAFVENPKACLVHFCLPSFNISSEVTPALIVDCCSQRANVFLFNEASRTRTTAEISSSGNKNPFVVQELATWRKNDRATYFSG